MVICFYCFCSDLCSEAHNGCSDWVKYWVHTGHLHIDGLKMSKSLKNFISIKDYLSNGWTLNPADDLRIYFLHHKYHSTLHFSRDRIQESAVYRHKMEEFFAQVMRLKDSFSRRSQCVFSAEGPQSARIREKLSYVKKSVKDSLMRDFDTPAVMRLLAELVSVTTSQILFAFADTSVPLCPIFSVQKYISSILSIFGLRFHQVLQNEYM